MSFGRSGLHHKSFHEKRQLQKLIENIRSNVENWKMVYGDWNPFTNALS